MRILVYPHSMGMGGSQINAIELAGALRDRGNEVAVIGEDGPLVQQVHDLGLPYLPLPDRRRRPSPVVARHLRALIRTRRLDVVHGYEWPPGLEASAAVFAADRTVAVCTVLSMAVAPFLPGSMPLVVGSRAIQEATAARRTGPVYLIEPPVDVDANAPGHPTTEFRARYDLPPVLDGRRIIDLVIVCRLVPELKLEGILTAVDVVGELAAELPVRLTVVGDGDARSTVEEHTARANTRAGWRAVVLTGQIMDPRPAYAAADIVLGMGGSALRALAFGKPLVVQGERGFWELLDERSRELFLEQGFYGVGDDTGGHGTGGHGTGGHGTGGHGRLTAILRALLPDAAAQAKLGEFGRELVVSRFSLQQAAQTQEDIYREALARRATGRALVGNATEGVRSAAGLTAYKLRRKYQTRRGTVAREDFNTVTLAKKALR